LTIGRAVAKALRRTDPTVAVPPVDRQLRRAVQRQRRPPYIYSPDEVKRLLDAARSMPSPHAPLRPLTLYTMIVLAYCAGLRLGEIVRLALGDLDLNDETLDIRDTKFFKHRRLPLAPSVAAVLREYLEACRRAGAPAEPDRPLFWQEQGRRGYSFVTIEKLLTCVLRRAELKPARGHSGPRIHDMRHAFAVRRLTDWYRAGLDAQTRLPHLATYLGHKDINSTLVYLTITQDLLQEASKRFHLVGATVLAESGGVPCR
jgi:integrase